MTEYQLTQSLTEWPGDVPSLIAEMKRRAKVETDQELAAFMGLAQSTVSHWRRRGRISQPTLLRFEKLAGEGLNEPDGFRAIAARMVAIRVAEFWFNQTQSGGKRPPRQIVYGSVAGLFQVIIDRVYAHLELFEFEVGGNAFMLAEQLMDDDEYLSSLVAWLKDVPLSDGLKREAASPLGVMLAPSLRFARFPNRVSQSDRAGKKPK